MVPLLNNNIKISKFNKNNSYIQSKIGRCSSGFESEKLKIEMFNLYKEGQQEPITSTDDQIVAFMLARQHAFKIRDIGSLVFVVSLQTNRILYEVSCDKSMQFTERQHDIPM